MEAKRDSRESIVNVTFQLKGTEEEEFRAYMEREFIDINSVAGKKLALERLQELKQKVAPHGM